MENIIENILLRHYGLKTLQLKRAKTGAGSNTFFATTDKGKFVLKNPSDSEINNPRREPELCRFLINRGIPASQFVKNLDGDYLTETDSGLFHLQKFVEGSTYDLNSAPPGLMTSSAGMLGRIHRALSEHEPLPVGIGREFFLHMTPENAAASYWRTMKRAAEIGDRQTERELEIRLELLQTFPCEKIEINRFTCGSTHGDYFISQLIAEGSEIRAVIDWTTACTHPLVWELIRSFVYGSPSCREGCIDIPEFLDYIAAYRQENFLPLYDLTAMPELFYYQLAVCDYYNQYYSSTAANREIYLHQARFSTALMQWLSKNMGRLQEATAKRFG